MARDCYYVSLKLLGRKDETPPAEASWPSKLGKKGAPEAIIALSASAEQHGRPCAEPTTDIIDVPLDDGCPEHSGHIRNSLHPLIKDAIVCLLMQYPDVFAFESSEISGIAPDVMQHGLTVNPSHKPVIKKRKQLGDRTECRGGCGG